MSSHFPTELILGRSAIWRMHGTSPSGTVFSLWPMNGLAFHLACCQGGDKEQPGWNPGSEGRGWGSNLERRLEDSIPAGSESEVENQRCGQKAVG